MELVLRAMERFEKDFEIQDHGVRALHNMSRDGNVALLFIYSNGILFSSMQG